MKQALWMILAMCMINDCASEFQRMITHTIPSMSSSFDILQENRADLGVSFPLDDAVREEKKKAEQTLLVRPDQHEDRRSTMIEEGKEKKDCWICAVNALLPVVG